MGHQDLWLDTSDLVTTVVEEIPVRALTVECKKCGHRENITIGTNEEVPPCLQPGRRGIKTCGGERVIIWLTGSAGFRVEGATKRF